MYGKIFSSIFDSTLIEDRDATYVFMCLIVLCDPDGAVDMTQESLARRINMPLDELTAALEKLEAPDSRSRTPTDDGARIALLDPDNRDWGWFIVNHKEYRDMASSEDRRESNRLAQQRVRDRQRSSSTVIDSQQAVSNGQQRSDQSAHTDTDTDTDTDMYKKRARRFSPPSLKEVTAYCKERGNTVSPNRFLNYYESNGWKVGRNAMKDWKAAVRTWEQRTPDNQPTTNMLRGAK